jgi:hypothetical protein
VKKSILVAAFAFAAFLLLGCVTSDDASLFSGTVQVKVSIYNGSAKTVKEIRVPTGSTALSAFQQVARLDTIEYGGMGAYVVAINGLRESAAENKFWQYYVDGAYAPVGVSAYKINAPMELEFRYEEPRLK